MSDTNSENLEINYHFVKSNYFRVIHADGVWGGLGPGGNIGMTLFSESLPLPQQVSHSILPQKSSDGATRYLLGPEVPEKRDVQEGFVREVEVQAIFNLGFAKYLHQWLGERIAELEKATEQGT